MTFDQSLSLLSRGASMAHGGGLADDTYADAARHAVRVIAGERAGLLQRIQELESAPEADKEPHGKM